MRAGLVLATAVALVSAGQILFQEPAVAQWSASEHLTITTDGEFHVLKDKRFPGKSIRARRPNFCESVEEWSGYLDIERPDGRPTHHFYWHSYESRNNPSTDPVQAWLNGGPGCSSFTGMLMELGPCNVARASNDTPVTLELNPWSWSSNETLVFLDQPVGVGYSYADHGDKGIYSTEEAAVDFHAFFSIWFEAFRAKFGKAPFHISGESYAGRYIPVFADYIVEQNKLARDDKDSEGRSVINLESVLIGNGFTAPTPQYASYIPTVCSNITGYGPFVNETACEQMRKGLPRCTALTIACAAEQDNAKICKEASVYCEATQTERYYETGRNPYDMEKFGDYPQSDWIEEFLNRKDVRHTLGVDRERDSGAPLKFIGCSDPVGEHFLSTGDNAKPSFPHVAHLLNNGVRVLIYAGTRDFICNWWGQEQWTRELEWDGRAKFAAEALRDWKVPRTGAAAGQFRTYGNFTFATVYNSGHFVPTDQPEAAQAMALAWVHGS